MRFDEVELAPVVFELPEEPVDAAPVIQDAAAPRFKRLLALLTDLSLFVALSLALSPLLPVMFSWTAIASLAGFVVIVSFYYFVAAWLLWGKTVGGAIFDVKVIVQNGGAMSFQRAARRWAGVYLSLLSGGLGFMLAALPSRLSLPDRVSGTCCIAG